jgi:hypothetical protein
VVSLRAQLDLAVDRSSMAAAFLSARLAEQFAGIQARLLRNRCPRTGPQGRAGAALRSSNDPSTLDRVSVAPGVWFI